MWNIGDEAYKTYSLCYGIDICVIMRHQRNDDMQRRKQQWKLCRSFVLTLLPADINSLDACMKSLMCYTEESDA